MVFRLGSGFVGRVQATSCNGDQRCHTAQVFAATAIAGVRVVRSLQHAPSVVNRLHALHMLAFSIERFGAREDGHEIRLCRSFGVVHREGGWLMP